MPDSAILPENADPHQRAVLKESTRLAFVSALQNLPGKQRAALLLTEVLECSAAEAAECLEMTVPALNSALQRSREKLGQAAPSAHTAPTVQTSASTGSTCAGTRLPGPSPRR